MRLAIFAACIWLWVSPALAQTPVPAVLGATYAVVADHDGRYADDYVLRDAGAVLEVRSAAYWTLDTITFPGGFKTVLDPNQLIPRSETLDHVHREFGESECVI